MPETPVRKVAAADLSPGQATAGMSRHEAIVLDDVWSGLAVTEPGVTSAWHHHGDHDTVAYVAKGVFRVETAAGVVVGEPGDFVHACPHGPSGEQPGCRAGRGRARAAGDRPGRCQCRRSRLTDRPGQGLTHRCG